MGTTHWNNGIIAVDCTRGSVLFMFVYFPTCIANLVIIKPDVLKSNVKFVILIFKKINLISFKAFFCRILNSDSNQNITCIYIPMKNYLNNFSS